MPALNFLPLTACHTPQPPRSHRPTPDFAGALPPAIAAVRRLRRYAFSAQASQDDQETREAQVRATMHVLAAVVGRPLPEPLETRLVKHVDDALSTRLRNEG